jgi:toxin ParE1/3/4
MHLKFRAAASADMRRVARETRARWGDAQAAKYVAQLRDDIKSLCQFPLRFPEFPARPNLRWMNSGRHAVFYLVLEDRIEIVRVLHGASDLEQWLE